MDPIRTATEPPQIYRIRTPNSPTSPKICRDIVTLLLQATGHHEHADAARLLVSELVTNVHLHTASQAVRLETVVRHDRVRVSVYDDAPVIEPHPKPPGAQAESGRGLVLLSGLAQEWGVGLGDESRGTGKRVWFELGDGRGR
ncbi:ATP-binding protein [Streptomyces phyllanthi]|nr:ATP-binding protein [Streptomyces phyllanthi]